MNPLTIHLKRHPAFFLRSGPDLLERRWLALILPETLGATRCIAVELVNLAITLVRHVNLEYLAFCQPPPAGPPRV